MSTITIWSIVVLANTGQSVELPNQYNTARECASAVEAIQKEHAGVSASCVARPIAVSEERARQIATEEWWRSQAPEVQSAEKSKP